MEGPSDLLYLTWFSEELGRRGRTRLDPRWTITPAGGLAKIGSFVSLFSGSKLHIAILTDYAHGEKQKVRDLRQSELLQAGHLFTADSFVPGDEADTEDIIGRNTYVDLVNRTYGLTAKQKLPAAAPTDAPVRVLAEVETAFKTLPASVPELDHYTPASYLVEHGAILRDELAGLEDALDRFEELFKALNALL